MTALSEPSSAMQLSPYERPPPAFPGMRIGLLGGSFNPAHEGHLHISRFALKRLGLHKLWWLVTPGNPLKSRSGLPDLPSRLRQAQEIATDPRIVVTGLEAGLSSTYACDTIRFLRTRFPGVRFVWIIGGDNLAQFHRWRHWQDIFQALPVLVADRPEFRHKALSSPAAMRFSAALASESAAPRLAMLAPPAWIYLSLPLCDLSSTAIRQGRACV